MPSPATPANAATRPDISVVIPTFRRPAELAQAIESVLAQEGVAVEVVVVDDCAAASAEPVVAGFADGRIAYRRNPAPSSGGPASLRNYGAGFARAELVHFLDDDDRVPAGHYAAARAVFGSAPATKLVFGRIEPFGPDAAAVAREAAYFARAAARARRLGRFGPHWGYAGAMLFRPTLLVCGAVILRRDCVPALGGFDPRLPLMEDVDFYARAIRRYGAHFLDGLALHYRIGPSLMHRPGQQPAIERSYAAMHAKYRDAHGWPDYLLLKLFATALRA